LVKAVDLLRFSPSRFKLTPFSFLNVSPLNLILSQYLLKENEASFRYFTEAKLLAAPTKALFLLGSSASLQGIVMVSENIKILGL